MKSRSLTTLIVFLTFSASIFASPVTYSFSSFGGGLPSSVNKVAANSQSNIPNSKRIIIEDDDSDITTPQNTYPQKQTSKKQENQSSCANTLTTCLVGGVILAAGIYFSSVYFTAETSECCQYAFDGFTQECSEQLGEACAEVLIESCTSDTAECSTELVKFLFGNGLKILPIYVP